MSDEVLGLLVALGAGLLIGLERERRKGRGPAREAAGLRTFTLACLGGALAQALHQPLLVPVGAAAVATLAALGYWRSTSRDPGLTTEVALVITYLIGALAVGNPPLAAASAAAVAMLLAARAHLHHFATRILSASELHDALLLAALALVLLPLVPERPLPWLGGLNPRTIALLVLLILALQAAGHVAQRLLGARAGMLLAGLLAGFVSSTATVASMGARLRGGAVPLQPACAGAVASSAATWIQGLALLAVLSPAAAWAYAPAAMAGSVMAAVLALALLRTGDQGTATADTPPQAAAGNARADRMIRLREAALVGGVLTLTTVVVGAAQNAFGSQGAIGAALFSGLVDAHASTAALGALSSAGQLTAADASVAALAAVAANSLSRGVVGWIAGGHAFGLRVGGALGLALAAAVSATLLVRHLQS